MTALRTSQPALPQMVSATLSHLRDGYDYFGGELDDAITLIDCGEPERAHAVRSMVPDHDAGLDLR